MNIGGRYQGYLLKDKMAQVLAHEYRARLSQAPIEEQILAYHLSPEETAVDLLEVRRYAVSWVSVTGVGMSTTYADNRVISRVLDDVASRVLSKRQYENLYLPLRRKFQSEYLKAELARDPPRAKLASRRFRRQFWTRVLPLGAVMTMAEAMVRAIRFLSARN
jgi:hypothetical protein